MGLSLGTLDGFLLRPLVDDEVRVSRVARHRPYGDKPAVSISGISAITMPVHELFGALAEAIARPIGQEVAR
jgi:hypothetical protein